MKNGLLLLVRHGESEWNAAGRWSGWADVHLTEKGHNEAKKLGEKLRDVKIDVAYHSEQVRTLETLKDLLKSSGQLDVPYSQSSAINERNYGDYTGKNKWEIKEKVGEDAFDDIRRGWDCPVSGGETLKMVYERSVPFYLDEVLPQIKQGKNVLLVASGNSIRSLIKYIESISDQNIKKVEMIIGTILIYEVDGDGKSLKKTKIMIETTPGKA